jgi:hypothetical protein
MKPSEIIAADAQNRGNDPKKELAFVKKAVELGGIFLREGETLLLLIPIGDNNAELHLYTQDSPLKLYKAMLGLWKKISASDLSKLYTDITNPQVVEMAKRTDWNVQPSDNPEYNTMVLVKG